MFERRTLCAPIRFEGLGLHSGAVVQATLRPSNSGIRLLDSGEWHVVGASLVTDTHRSTRLGGVRTVEHLMSALSGVGITDVDIEVVGGELPSMDGSAAPFVKAIREAGWISLGPTKSCLLAEPVDYREGSIRVAVKRGSGKWSYSYTSESLWPYSATYGVDDIALEYDANISAARTFIRRSQLAALDSIGLARGIDRSSALIVGESGYATPPRFPSELVAHKLLDLVGDLYLIGIPARYLDVVAEGSGHRTNVLAASIIQGGAVTNVAGKGRRG